MQYKHYKIEYERAKAVKRDKIEYERRTEYVVGFTAADAIDTFYNYISKTYSHDRHTAELLYPIISIEEEKE